MDMVGGYPHSMDKPVCLAKGYGSPFCVARKPAAEPPIIPNVAEDPE